MLNQSSASNCRAPNSAGGSGYVLMTSAFNEEKYIERTIQSVISQTILPLAWVIVSDGSTDQTDSICAYYAASYGFIRYLRMEHTADEKIPKFGAVAYRRVNAIARAIECLSSIPYAYIGDTDAHVTIAPDFFEKLMRHFEKDPNLGIGGGFIYNVADGGKTFPAFVNPRNVGGPLQFFRAACYRDIGGYVPFGHEDTIALIAARMKGWATASFPDLQVYHHKSANWVGFGRWKAKYKLGTYDYMMSDSLPWEALRCLKETGETPPVLGSCFRFAGYLKGIFTERRILTLEQHHFVRSEQYRILMRTLSQRLRRARMPASV